MVACAAEGALDRGHRERGLVVVELAQVQEDLVDRLARAQHLVHGADAVRVGDLVVHQGVSLEIAQTVGEPLVVALQVGYGAQLAAQGDDLGREIRVYRSVGQAGAGLLVPQERATAGDHGSVQLKLLMKGADVARRPRRHQHHLDPALAHVGYGALGSLGDEARTREQGAVEVYEHQAYHSAGTDQLGKPARHVVQVVAHGVPRLGFVARPDGLPYGVVLLLQGHGAAGLVVVDVEDGGHVVVQQSHRLLDDALEQRVVSGVGYGGVKGHIFFWREHLAGVGDEHRETVQVFKGGSAGGEAGRLDLHRAPDLHQLDDALRSLADEGAPWARRSWARAGWRRWCPGRRGRRPRGPGP